VSKLFWREGFYNGILICSEVSLRLSFVKALILE